MSDKQVTVKSMMLDFAAKLRKDGREVVSLEFFERLANKEVAALEQRVEELESGHEQVVEWSKAYPLDVFPEPDFKKAAELLKAGGMTLDAISASNMRHVVEGVGKIAKGALASQEEARSPIEP